MTTMVDVVRLLKLWLNENNLPASDITLDLVFSMGSDCYKADAAVRRELRPEDRPTFRRGDPVDAIATIEGVHVRVQREEDEDDF